MEGGLSLHVDYGGWSFAAGGLCLGVVFHCRWSVWRVVFHCR